MARVASGDRGAFQDVVIGHQEAVYRFANALCDSPQAAEDVLQESFLIAYRSAHTFRGEASLRTWLLAITRRRAGRQRRRRVGEPSEWTPLHELGERAGWGRVDAPEAMLDAARCRQRITRALNALETGDREILVLRDIEQFSGPETAALLEISLPAMKSRLHRARLRLVAMLRRGERDA